MLFTILIPEIRHGLRATPSNFGFRPKRQLQSPNSGRIGNSVRSPAAPSSPPAPCPHRVRRSRPPSRQLPKSSHFPPALTARTLCEIENVAETATHLRAPLFSSVPLCVLCGVFPSPVPRPLLYSSGTLPTAILTLQSWSAPHGRDIITAPISVPA